MSHRFKKIAAWQMGMELARAVYTLTSSLPQEEIYGLTAQLRRASVSVPSNIAEGAGRGSNADFARFLHIAIGSLNEVETQLLLADQIFGLPATSSGTLNLVDRCGG